MVHNSKTQSLISYDAEHMSVNNFVWRGSARGSSRKSPSSRASRRTSSRGSPTSPPLSSTKAPAGSQKVSTIPHRQIHHLEQTSYSFKEASGLSLPEPSSPREKPQSISTTDLNQNLPRSSVTKEVMCSNHESKSAQFMISTEDEQLPYCQKCSILLASQGFKLTKLNGIDE